MDATAPARYEDIGAFSSVEDKLDIFFNQYRFNDIEAGRVFMFPAEKIESIFYVIEGTVRVYDVTSNGNEVVVNVFQKQSLFPMSKVLNETPNLYFYQASTPVRISQAPVKDFVEFLVLNNDVTLKLLALSYLEAQDMRRRMAHLMGGRAVNRLIYELIVQSYRHGRQQPDMSYLIDINESEVGARSGLSRETVSREIKKLKKRQLITVGYEGLVVHDVKKLEAMLGTSL